MSYTAAKSVVACGPTTSAPTRGGSTPPPPVAVEAGFEPGSGAEAPPSAPIAPAEPTLDADARALLDAHNQHRVSHCAPPLAWSAALARTAQAWADGLGARGCTLEHSRSAHGENLAAGTAGSLPAAGVVALWYRESARYSFRHPGFSMQTGHFTQLVWRNTTEVGCGRTACGGLELWVCNYDPPGNVQRAYEDNVLPTSCRER